MITAPRDTVYVSGNASAPMQCILTAVRQNGLRHHDTRYRYSKEQMILSKSDRYDYIVTGASGNVGRHLIPILEGRGYRILAVGRDSAALRRIYLNNPMVHCAEYVELASICKCDTLIHLAIRNNNQSGSIEEFLRDNVQFSQKISSIFELIGGRRFINVSSIHSIEKSVESSYSISKGIAVTSLKEILGKKLDNIYIGYFYSDSYFGHRLSYFNNRPSVGKLIFHFFKLIRPTTSSDNLANYVIDEPDNRYSAVIITDDIARSSIYRGVMRALDLTAAVIILSVFLPLLLIISLIIRLDSQGPVIFAQTRVGKGQVHFTLYKFRTMKKNTVAAGTHEVSVNAVTKVGRFLRKTKLDELPQAINLLRGEMTLVGPRPCLPVQEELVNARSELGIYALKPGITGYAQIRQIDMSRAQNLADADYIYMKLQSFVIDLKIILSTVVGRGRGDRVSIS